MLDEIRDKTTAAKTTLGSYLASIRADRKFSLRQVEQATGKEVSNAYLSQIETGKIVQPSPNVLHALAEIYAISYEHLMQLAGYIRTASKARPDNQRHGQLAAFAEHNLTPNEETELMQYLKFMRNRNAHGDKS
jgi:transcriptional regulator with XRE-family HTH domain